MNGQVARGKRVQEPKVLRTNCASGPENEGQGGITPSPIGDELAADFYGGLERCLGKVGSKLEILCFTSCHQNITFSQAAY